MIGKARKLDSPFKNNNKNIEKIKVFDTINEIADNVGLFNLIANPTEPQNAHSNEDINTLLLKVKQTGMESSIPFVLALLQEQKASQLAAFSCFLKYFSLQFHMP